MLCISERADDLFRRRTFDATLNAPVLMHGATSLTDNKPATSMFLAVIPKSFTVGQNVNLSAFINVQGATGTVTFLDGGNSIGASRLNGSGNSVQLSTKALGVGDHPLTASTRATRITTQSPAV